MTYVQGFGLKVIAVVFERLTNSPAVGSPTAVFVRKGQEFAMTEIRISTIRLTLKQRTWIMSYLLIGAPHPPDDPFCALLVKLLSQPMAAVDNVKQWEGVFPDGKAKK